PVGFSAGIAAAPRQAADRQELVRVADLALYTAKAEGKNRVRVYNPDVSSVASLERLPDRADPTARIQAAASLACCLVDARDRYVGAHSQRVAELAGAIAARLGLDPEHAELVRLAGALHDVGKLAIAEELLKKEGPLTPEERTELQRHAELGHRMLDAL